MRGKIEGQAEDETNHFSSWILTQTKYLIFLPFSFLDV
jgi:hypothetical protein